jgi:hypothetical protein
MLEQQGNTMGIKEDNTLISLIAHRASIYYRSHGRDISPEFIASELHTTHEEICTLRLNELLHADIGNFIHDIAGIHANIDILNASFKNSFRPRFAK